MNSPVTILKGCMLDELRKLPDNSVDAIVTDPPYGLGKEPDALAMLRDWLETGHHEVKGRGFMGKAWDAFVPQPVQWRECFRVLKPGGHLLAFAGSRTQDLMALGLRLAGFEIRDLVAWLYGSGFPKSLNVGKALDATAGAQREIVSQGKPVKRMIPGADQNNSGWIKDNGREYLPTQSLPATADALQWEGWGTALKPALEPITLARKPLDGTVAENVLKWHTGALNVDGCRVQSTGESLDGGRISTISEGWDRPWKHDGASIAAAKARGVENVAKAESLGRWPANVIHDGSDEVLRLFPDAPGAQGAVTGAEPTDNGFSGCVYGHAGTTLRALSVPRQDSGSSARFFYCAKTSAADRNEGCEALPDHDWRAAGAAVPERGQRPFTPSKNHHPTVKPTALMRYLCRLITPPGGLILDPFMGSGSTGKAAVLEGFRFLGIDKEAEYTVIARTRIAAAQQEVAHAAQQTELNL